jgi:hypothetical protein
MPIVNGHWTSVWTGAAPQVPLPLHRPFACSSPDDTDRGRNSWSSSSMHC